MYNDLLTLGVFLLVAGLGFLVLEAVFGRRQARRRERVTELFRDPVSDEPPVVRTVRSRGFSARMFDALAWIVPQLPVEIQGISQDLKRAGFYAPTALKEYLVTRNVLLIAVLASTCVFGYAVRDNPRLLQTTAVIGFCVLAMGYGLPRITLRFQANSRIARIRRGLPDALDMVTMCVAGGLPLQKALTHVVGELNPSHPEVATELHIIRQQADAGSMAQALREFASRIDAPEVRSLAALVGQADRLGTNVSTALQDYCDSMRRTARQRAEERASTASVKLLFPVALCLAPPVYVLLCGPAVVELRNFVLRENRAGGILTGGAGAMAAPLAQARNEAAAANTP